MPSIQNTTPASGDGAQPYYFVDPDSVHDRTLIASYRAGDKRAAGHLFERHRAAATRYAWQFVSTPEAVEEVVSESFVKVFEILSRGKGPTDSFRFYLLTVVRNVSADWHRDRGQFYTVDTFDDVVDENAPDAALRLAEGDSEIIAAFNNLPERWREILRLRALEGGSVTDIAQAAGVTPVSVSMLYSRAKDGLRKLYLEQLSLVSTRGACTEFSGDLARNAFAPLRGEKREKLESHVADCLDCRRTRAELDRIVARFAKTAAVGVFPAGLGTAVMATSTGGGTTAAALLGGGLLASLLGVALALGVASIGITVGVLASQANGPAVSLDTGGGACELMVDNASGERRVELTTRNGGQRECTVTFARDGRIIDGPRSVTTEQVLVTAQPGHYTVTLTVGDRSAHHDYTID